MSFFLRLWQLLLANCILREQAAHRLLLLIHLIIILLIPAHIIVLGVTSTLFRSRQRSRHEVVGERHALHTAQNRHEEAARVSQMRVETPTSVKHSWNPCRLLWRPCARRNGEVPHLRLHGRLQEVGRLVLPSPSRNIPMLKSRAPLKGWQQVTAIDELQGPLGAEQQRCHDGLVLNWAQGTRTVDHPSTLFESLSTYGSNPQLKMMKRRGAVWSPTGHQLRGFPDCTIATAWYIAQHPIEETIQLGKIQCIVMQHEATW
mmetsp:Transcript_97903/g.204180  ORF Transcript_97903/g.204180 Transcript_97903/m.204180 type:complete len:260 (-) Transcript_97903:754-1533(-)